MSVKTLVILMSALAGIAAMAGGPCAADHDPAAKIFNTYCSPCHGETGGGNGPIGAVLARRPRNFTDCDQMKKLSDDHIFKVIKQGGRGAGLSPESPMPRWQVGFTDEDIHALVKHLRLYCTKPGPTFHNK